MTAEQAKSKTGRRPAAGDLLTAAAGLVEAGGLAALTLRPLAARLGVSVSVLTTHFGDRLGVLGAIVEAARIEDAEAMAPWSERFTGLARIDPVVGADLADALLDALAGPRRPQSLLFVELVQASHWDGDLREIFAPWFQQRSGFWNRLGARAGMPAALLETGFMAGYGLDELTYSIALADLPAYRLLRRIGLRRLFSGFAARPADLELFGALFAELDDPDAVLKVVHNGTFPADWRADVARASAVLITTRGPGAITHRAVASESGVAATTLSYRFPTQIDLLIAGLEHMISQQLRSVEQRRLSLSEALNPDIRPKDLDVGRATFAVAIAATRMPGLVPCAADMRRRRGISLIRVLQQQSLGNLALDALSAQSLSVGFIGMANALAVSGRDGRQVEAALIQAVAWAQSQAESNG